MLRKTFGIAVIVFALTALALSATFFSDDLKGEWYGLFAIASKSSEAKIKFEIEGDRLTGTVFTEHTGLGTVTDGVVRGSKFKCTLRFEKHEAIQMTGEILNDKLSGSFTTEGMTGTWTAKRK